MLLLQFAVALALLGVGVVCYIAVTPFHERELVRAGNTAAGIVAGGNFVALAIPLAATLADQPRHAGHRDLGRRRAGPAAAGLRRRCRLIPGLRGMIEADNIAAACMLVGMQLAVALLNAGAMAG